jgi:hypothetical protein
MPFHRGYQGEFGSVEKSPKVLLFLCWRPFPQWRAQYVIVKLKAKLDCFRPKKSYVTTGIIELNGLKAQNSMYLCF